MSALQAFANSIAGARLETNDKPQTRVAIKHGKRTIAYIGIGRDSWGDLMVHRFNQHEELLAALREMVDLALAVLS